MIKSLDNFPFLKEIIQNTDVIVSEFESQLKKSDLLTEFINSPPGKYIPSHVVYWAEENKVHPDQIGYTSDEVEIVAFPLFKKDFPIKWFNVEQEFPQTNRLIYQVPNVNFSAFFKLCSGAQVYEHQHGRSNYIFHLCLFDLDGESIMRCNGTEKILSKKGDWCLFDYSKPHSSVNNSSKSRINLVLDFTPQINK